MSSTKQTKHSTPLLARRTAVTKPSGAPLRKGRFSARRPGPAGNFAKGGSIYLKELREVRIAANGGGVCGLGDGDGSGNGAGGCSILCGFAQAKGKSLRISHVGTQRNSV